MFNKELWFDIFFRCEAFEAGFELAVRNSQFAKRFGSLRMSFCIFSKNCESLNSDTS